MMLFGSRKRILYSNI